jgi:hypothetical protein
MAVDRNDPPPIMPIEVYCARKLSNAVGACKDAAIAETQQPTSKDNKMAKKMMNKKPEESAPTNEEQIEGLDDTVDSGLGDYPIDTLLIRKETRTVFDVVRRIGMGAFILNPDFQRDFVWDPDKQSKLIESVVMRIPLPVLYLAEDSKGRTIVVDGLQRLSTFRDFLANKFKLKLPHQESLDKRFFNELPAKLQNRIEDCNLELYIIDSKVPERAKLDIFERVNSGELLTRQQMRNCLFMGQATQWLKQEASTELFLEATGQSLNAKKMRDREFANRFCAFHLLGVDNYTTSDMDGFLAKSLEQMNTMSENDLKLLSKTFRLGLQNNFELFERHAFRKHSLGQSNRSVVNASLWDVMSTGLSRYPNELVKRKADEFQKAFFTLLEDGVFNDAITYSPNSTNKVHTRFKMANKLFTEVLGDY